MRLLRRGVALAFAVEKWINKGIWIICRSDSGYPSLLRNRLNKYAPPILFGVGKQFLIDQGGLAIVGSRNIDSEGEIYTKELGQFCAKNGIQVISGGAKGVDRLAMQSVLDAGGSAIGVLAENLMKASVSVKYRQAIKKQRLLLVSPYNPESSFNVGNAMGRNKYIYALADYGLVISTDYQKGGTWSGAVEELRREKHIPLFVRGEGIISKGNKELLKKGAIAFPVRPWDSTLTDLLEQSKQFQAPLSEQLSLLNTRTDKTPVESFSEKENINLATANQDSVCKKSEKEILDYDSKIPSSVYEAVLPVLLKTLDNWMTTDELLGALDIRKGQLEDWLKRAIKEKHIEKKKNPVRYRRSEKSRSKKL